MKNLKRVLALSMAGCLAIGALAGCNNGGKDNSGSGSNSTAASDGAATGGDATKGSVYWLNFKPESDKTLQEVAKMYTKETGVNVKVVTAASGTYEQTLSSEMDKSDAPTLFVIGNSAGVKQWGPYALDLKDTDIAKELNTDAYNLYDADGKLVSIGYCYEAYGIIVNPDLLEKAGHKIDEIKNFDTLKTVVEDIHKNASKLGFDAFTSCDMDDSSSWRFTGHMANLEYFYEEKKAGKTWTECPASLTGDYIQNYKNLFDLCINNSISDPKELATGGHDPSAQFASQKAAFTVQGSWEWTNENQPIKDKVPNAKMIPYYCGVEGEEKAGLNCGTENCWAVNSKASEDDQAATLAFMKWCVTNKEASEKLVNSFGVMPYKNAVDSSNQFLKNANDYTSAGNYVMDWATNYQPNSKEYRAQLVSALNTYCADQSDKNWEQVKSAFVDGWATQYAAANS